MWRDTFSVFLFPDMHYLGFIHGITGLLHNALAEIVNSLLKENQLYGHNIVIQYNTFQTKRMETPL